MKWQGGLRPQAEIELGVLVQIAGWFLSSIAVITLSMPVLAVPSCLIFVVYYFLRKYFLASSRSVKRLENISKSPIFTQLHASLEGLTTIR